MMDRNPLPTSLSVIVVPLVGGEPLKKCLDALLQQAIHLPTNIRFELIVPLDEALVAKNSASVTNIGGTIPDLRLDFPAVNFLDLPGRRTPAELRAEGVRCSIGEIIAITEDHCLPDARWCAAILESHRLPHAAIGGTVDKLSPDTALNWAVYFADYLRYSSPMPDGPTGSLTDLNVTYKRAALEAIREVWEDEFHENAVHSSLQEKGEILWLSPAINVNQQRSFSLGSALRDRVAFGRLFASTRVRMISTGKRLFLIASSILIPLLQIYRVFRMILRRRRWLGAFMRSFFYLALLSIGWAWGEFTGYLTGKAGTSLSPQEGR